jgi:flagellar basal body-associated protein FliL
MFEQFIGDGASLFITIVAVLVGFATALGYIDFMKTKKEEKKED